MSWSPRPSSSRYIVSRWLRVNDEESKEKHGVKILLGGFSSLRAKPLNECLALLLTLKVDVSQRKVGRASNDRPIRRFASLTAWYKRRRASFAIVGQWKRIRESRADERAQRLQARSKMWSNLRRVWEWTIWRKVSEYLRKKWIFCYTVVSWVIIVGCCSYYIFSCV